MSAATHFQAASFDADTTRAMGVAFDMACHSLRLSDVTDPLTRIVASKIVDTATSGEHDAVRLHDAVMRWVASV